MPMPAIANPDTPPEEEKETRHPDFTTLNWQKTRVKEQEVVTLTASVKDIADGNGATFQVWKKGQDPEGGIPQFVKATRIEGGEAKAEYSYKVPNGETIPEEDPEFFFTVHCAWCPYKKSGMLTVELAKLKNAVWQDAEGNKTGKGLVGAALKPSVESEDFADGEEVLFRVYSEGANPEHDKPEAARQGTIKGGKAEAEWTYRYKHNPDKPLTEKPKFFFTASGRCHGTESGTVEISQTVKGVAQDRAGNVLGNCAYEIFRNDEPFERGTTDSEGRITYEDLIPGKYSVVLKHDEDEENGKR
jgi:hypothetical protein